MNSFKRILQILIIVIISFTLNLTVNAKDELEEVYLSPKDYETSMILCEEYNIPFELFVALMYTESRFNPKEVNYNSNGTYDTGICQINSCHIKELEKLNLNITNTEDNMRYACIILSSYLIEFKSEYKALQIYNSGIGGFKNGYGEKYAAKVMNIKRIFEQKTIGGEE